MAKSYLCLGGNLGDRQRALTDSVEKIGTRAGRVSCCSSIYISEPWGFEHASYFLNQVIVIETMLIPSELLHELQLIEMDSGRVKHKEDIYEARRMDIDILFYDDISLTSDGLVIPHPLLHLRKFVLLPLCEIAPDHIHPVLKKTSLELLSECSDKKEVRLF